MDRRLLLKGIFGLAGAVALTAVLPPGSEVLAASPTADPAAKSSVLPNLEELKAGPEDGGQATQEAGEQLAYDHRYRHRRHRGHRRRRWRRVCRSYRHHGHWRRRCRREPFWVWIGIG